MVRPQALSLITKTQTKAYIFQGPREELDGGKDDMLKKKSMV
jgi:hypothetical protein